MMKKRAFRVPNSLVSILIAAIVWEIMGRYVLNDPLFFVPLSAVLRAFAQVITEMMFWKHLYVSFLEFFLGYFLAAAVGITVGLMIAVSRLVREYLDPLINALYATPLVALAPLFIAWFGLGLASKIAVIFLMAVFPVLINTAAGIRSTPPDFIEVAQSFRANKRQIFFKVLLPSAQPFIITGLRLGIARGLVGVVVAELFGARAGIGYFIMFAGQTFSLDQLFVGVLVLAGAGVLSNEALIRLERRLSRGRPMIGE